MAFSQDFIDRVRNSVDIVDVIDAAVPLKKHGKNHFACCPFHEEKTPSFSVNSDEQLYFCHGSCGEGGNVFNFYMQYHRVDFPDAVREVAKVGGVPLEEEQGRKGPSSDRVAALGVLERASEQYHNQLPDNAEVVDLLVNRRGVTPKSIEAFNLGAAKNEWRSMIDTIDPSKNFKALVASGLAVYEPKTEQARGKFYDRFRNSVIFPIRDDKGKVVSFAQRRIEDTPSQKMGAKYINGPETELFKKSRVAYGLYESLQNDPSPESLTVVEGYMDVVMAHQNGATNTVGTMGTTLGAELGKRLYRYTDKLTFCFDGDRAGAQASQRALVSVLPLLDDSSHAEFVILPPGSDPDSFIKKSGIEAYKQYLAANAKPASNYILHLARKGVPNLDTAENRGQLFSNAKTFLDQMPPSGMKAALLSRLEDMTGIRPTEYMPYSVQLKEGHCNGVDLGSLETEFREFVARKIGVPAGDVRVNWAMPEAGPRIAQAANADVAGKDARQEVGLRMREVGRILSLETPVAQGLSLAQLVNTAQTGQGEHQLMAKGLITRYLRDTTAFETECQISRYHMGVIREKMGGFGGTLEPDAAQQVTNWLETVKVKSANLAQVVGEVEPGVAHRIERSIAGIQADADGLLARLDRKEQDHEIEANIAPMRAPG